MSKKDKRREALRLGKKDMSFAEIMQAIEACRADDCDKCLLNGGPIAGWFPEDVPDCYTVLLKNAGEKLLEYYQKIRENDAAEENQRKTEENIKKRGSKSEGGLGLVPRLPGMQLCLRRIQRERRCKTAHLSIWRRRHP